MCESHVILLENMSCRHMDSVKSLQLSCQIMCGNYTWYFLQEVKRGALDYFIWLDKIVTWLQLYYGLGKLDMLLGAITSFPIRFWLRVSGLHVLYMVLWNNCLKCLHYTVIVKAVSYIDGRFICVLLKRI